MSCLPIIPVLKAFSKNHDSKLGVDAVITGSFQWGSTKTQILFKKRNLYHTLINVTEDSGSIGTFVCRCVKWGGGGHEMMGTNGSMQPHKCNVAFSPLCQSSLLNSCKSISPVDFLSSKLVPNKAGLSKAK